MELQEQALRKNWRVISVTLVSKHLTQTQLRTEIKHVKDSGRLYHHLAAFNIIIY